MEIKYKAWDIKRKIWITPTFINLKNKTLSAIVEKTDKGDWESVYRFEEVKFLQFTGLKDTNGVEIYEGDLVKDFITGKIYEVIWDNYGMFIFTKIGSTSGGYNYYDLEDEVNTNCFMVIGNIYENKDLIDTK